MPCAPVPSGLASTTPAPVRTSPQYRWLASTATPRGPFWSDAMPCAPVPSRLASMIVPAASAQYRWQAAAEDVAGAGVAEDGAGDPELEADVTTAIAAATPALRNTATTPAITVVRARYSLSLFMLFLLSRDWTCPAGAATSARKSCPALDGLPTGRIGYGQRARPQCGCLSPS